MTYIYPRKIEDIFGKARDEWGYLRDRRVNLNNFIETIPVVIHDTNKNSLRLYYNLAGFDKKNISVTSQGYQITVSAKREAKEFDKLSNVKKEYSHTTSVLEDGKIKNIECSFENGILLVVVNYEVNVENQLQTHTIR